MSPPVLLTVRPVPSRLNARLSEAMIVPVLLTTPETPVWSAPRPFTALPK